MADIDDVLWEVSSKTPDQEPAVPLAFDLVGAVEAAELLGIGRAALWERRRQHENFPKPVAELRCGPIWLRWQIQHYAAEEARLGLRVSSPPDATRADRRQRFAPTAPSAGANDRDAEPVCQAVLIRVGRTERRR